MRIGPYTVRRTKDIEAEQAKRDKDKAKAVSAKLEELLMHRDRQYKSVLHRWGLSEGIIGKGASQGAKTPKGAGASV